MADFNIGDVTARLTADASQFQRTIQQAIQSLQQLTQATTQARQAQTTNQQSTNQLATASLAMAQAIQQQTQAYAQAQGAALTFRRAQDEQRQATRQAREEIQAQARAVQDVTRGSGEFLRGVATVAGGVGLATTIQGAIAQLVRLGTESVNTASQMQNLHLAFTALRGTATEATRVLEQTFQTAQRLGVEFTPLVAGLRRMEQSARGTSLEGANMLQILEGVASGARTLGVTSTEVGRALDALGQIMTKGRASAEEINQQLGDAIPGGLNTMARALGLTTQRFQEMVQLGVLPASVAVAGFARGMQDIGQSSGNVTRMADTFARLRNESTLWMQSLGEGIGRFLVPFLQELTLISEELRTIFRIGPPSTRAPGASQGFGVLLPRSTGFLPANPYMPSEFEAPGARPNPFEALIRQQAERIQFDTALFSRLIQRESAFNPRALGPQVAGQGRAMGLGQLMPRTGAELGLLSPADFYDPEKNLTAAATLLKQYRDMLREKFGTLADETRILLAAYNAGIGNVTQAMEATLRAGQQPTFAQVLQRLPKPGETGPYVEFITGLEAGTAPGGLPGPTRPSTVQAPIDPFASIGDEAVRIAQSIQAIQTQMDHLATSGLNVGGVLNQTLVKAANDAIDRYAQLAGMFAAFPEQLQRLTPVQREQLTLAAEQVLAIQNRLQNEVQAEAGAAQTIRRFREELQLEEREQAQADKAYAEDRIRDLRRLEEAQERVNAEMEREDRAHAEQRLAALREIAREEEQQIEMLRRLAGQYTQTKEVRDSDTASLVAGTLATSQYAGEAQHLVSVIETGMQQRYTQGLQEQLAHLQTPANLGTAGRIRVQAGLEGREFTREDEALLGQIEATERLLGVMGTVEQVGVSAAGAITNAFLQMADRTQTVSQAFARMAQSILQSTAQILLNEGFRALIRLGIGALTGAFMPTTPLSVTPQGGVYQGAAGGGAPFLPPPIAFQHGGMVTRPTLALVGENAAHNPEYVLNRQQMQGIMTSSQGGTSAGKPVVVMNFPNRQAAEDEAGRQRGLGHQVVMNEVMNDLQRGESSQINRMLRTLQR